MRPTRTVALIGFVVTFLTILIVPLVLVHAADRSAYFWWRITWTDFLALLTWSYLGGILSAPTALKSMPRVAGVAPAYDLIVLPYSGLSFGLVVCFAWLDPTDGPNRLHMALQVALLATTIIVSALLYLPAHFSAAGTSHDPNRDQQARRSVPPPSELGSQLRCEEERFATPGTSGGLSDADRHLYQTLKGLREKLMYSLDGVHGVEDSPEYRELATRVVTVCSSLSLVRASSGSGPELDAADREVQALTRMAANINNSLKRR